MLHTMYATAMTPSAQKHATMTVRSFPPGSPVLLTRLCTRITTIADRSTARATTSTQTAGSAHVS